MTDSIYWIWMQLMFGVGTQRAVTMREYFSHPRVIYESIQAGTQAMEMLRPKELAASELSMQRAAEMERRMSNKGCVMITPTHPDYPPLLRDIACPPAVLYAKGDLSCLRHSLAIAMVGSRQATEYGRQVAGMLARELAIAGAVVVSGLAVGIDAASHRGALNVGGKTIGILGCGIDVDYPQQNRALKTEVSRNGAVITEFLPGTVPRPWTFPLRNRLISGMSHGTVVVQAGENSGALLTARHAEEQGRKVFAVPSNLFQPSFMGTNRLIQEGARLVGSAADILAACAEIPQAKRRMPQPEQRLLTDTAAAPSEPQALPSPPEPVLPSGLSGIARTVYAVFGEDTITVDEVAAQTGAEIGEILSALTELELYALIQRHPGRKFGRNT